MFHPAFSCPTAFLLALLAGWALGTGDKHDSNESITRLSPRQRAEDPGRTKGKPWTAEDFILSFAEKNRTLEAFNADPLVAYLEKWTDEEIGKALDESLADPQLLLSQSGSAGVTHNLFRQLVDRDFMAASAWFSALPDHRKMALSPTLLLNWPADRPQEGMEFIRANRLLCAGKEPRIINHYLADVAKRGAMDFVTAIRDLESEGFEPSYYGFYAVFCGNVSGLGLPPGFDFATLFSTKGMGFQPDSFDTFGSFTNSAFAQWQDQDRDAALRWVTENHDVAVLSQLPNGWGDTEENGVWFSKKLSAMAEPRRADLLRSGLGSWVANPTNARFTVAAAQETPIHREVLSYGVQGLFYGQYGECVPMLESIREPEERIRFLEKLEHIPLVAEVAVTPERKGADSLREKLRSWGADDSRIDALMKRLRERRLE